MNDKIKQIIPAPTDMWAVYESHASRVVCLALMEDGEDVRAMLIRGTVALWNLRTACPALPGSSMTAESLGLRADSQCSSQGADFWVCPHCGAYLDPWEACDCWKPPATRNTAPAIDPRVMPLLRAWRAEVKQASRER